MTRVSVSYRAIPSPSFSGDVAEPNFHPPLHYGGIHPSSIVITASIRKTADIPLHGASIVIPCFTSTLQFRFSSYCFYGP